MLCVICKKKEAPLFEEALLFKGVGVIVTGRLTLLGCQPFQSVGLLLARVLERCHLEPELHPHFNSCSGVGTWHCHASAVAQSELWLRRERSARGYRDTHVGKSRRPKAWPEGA